ncbi:hypothetical protein [Streptomyces sp. WAC01280]|uniref:DUF7739 domain-containing protein n=1 Tax=Streptomyces sp. WAC01280 TaxID=2487424 RepID=UPI000F7A3C40|nr:hypothetical protein [Streptomyces sp. WAC01280]RSS50090.1 hypothetical protein EF909_39275 [Streptomyces sp. WAC01280]
MATHLVVSHGADFFGQDRHDITAVTGLTAYAEVVLPAAERRELVELLEHAADGQTIEPATAAVLAEQLLRVSRHKGMAAKPSRLARLLADAASRATTDGEAWTWTATTETELAA